MKRQLRSIVQELSACDSRIADALILAGKVLVNDEIITKPGIMIKEESIVRIKESDSYVSRGAHKLLAAVKHYNVDVMGKCCIDCGSSTGGFTQVLLENGAERVYAVDCGTNQLDYSIRRDPRVISIEGRRVQDITYDECSPPPVFASCDVSFTSCIPVILHLFRVLLVSEAVVLIKPQFEYARLRKELGLSAEFNGIVNDVDSRQKIVDKVVDEIRTAGLHAAMYIESPIKGTDGNVEYIIRITGAVE